MTKILLTGITLATILLSLGMSAQSYALPMPDKTQDSMLGYTLAKNAMLDNHLMLVSDAPTTKGGMVTFHLIPRPHANADGILVVPQTNSSQLILANVPTAGGSTMLKWIPKPQEGIDGIIMPKPTASTTDIAHTAASPLPETVLTSVPTSGGGTTLKAIPKSQEGIDGIAMSQPTENPMILVSEPVTSKGGMTVLHLMPKPAPNPFDSTS
jgi:hypothetical protein